MFHVERPRARRPACSHLPPVPPCLARPITRPFDILTSPRPRVGSRRDSRVPALPSTTAEIPTSGFTECGGMAVARLGETSRYRGRVGNNPLGTRRLALYPAAGRRCRRGWPHSGRPPPFCNRLGRPAVERHTCVCNDLGRESGPSRLPRGPIGASGLHRQRPPPPIRPPGLTTAETYCRLPRLAARSAMAGRGPHSTCRDRAARPDQGIRRRGQLVRGHARPCASCDACHLSDPGLEHVPEDVQRSRD